MRRALILVAAAALAGCDAGPKATTAKSEGPPPAASPASPSEASSGYAPSNPADAPVRLVAGKPLWSSNRRMSAEENARSHFQRDGADFDAKTVDDFVAKAHAFTARPPKSALRLERPNGDLLLYEEKTNTFAVMSRQGAPRTMFKPRRGMDYWREQVRREKEKSSRD
jgi:pyocin large subunit-like protein